MTTIWGGMVGANLFAAARPEAALFRRAVCGSGHPTAGFARKTRRTPRVWQRPPVTGQPARRISVFEHQRQEAQQNAVIPQHSRSADRRKSQDGGVVQKVKCTPAWAWFDNLFDTTGLWQYYGGVLHGHNAYFNCPNRLLPSGSPGDLSLTALSYTADAWGRRWYAQATPALADASSRAAAAAGLWHYTTRPDQVREGATPVDVGFHYVAAEPAEVERAVAGTALSASSSYSNGQWNPPRARDGL
jgi:hypothetical protein